jgi:hypothetical protein
MNTFSYFKKRSIHSDFFFLKKKIKKKVKKKKMSKELEVLQKTGLIKKRNNSIPFGVLYWGSFITCIFKKKAIPQDLDRTIFSQRAKRWLKKSGPKSVRKSQEYIRQVVKIWWSFYEKLCLSIVEVKNTRDRGFGVFVTLEEIRKVLTGLIAWVDSEEFAKLKKGKYPSLFCGKCILFGPLSLVNHECCSALRFTRPRQRLDGFPEITIKNLEPKTFRKGEEVLVDYFGGDEPDFVCNCRRCKKKKKKKTPTILLSR